MSFADLKAIFPLGKKTVYANLQELGFDVSDWVNYKTPSRPAANPKYCYEWSFLEPTRFVAMNIWHPEISDDGRLTHSNNYRRDEILNSRSIWKRRAGVVDRNIQTAFLEQLPIHVMVLAGRRRDRKNPASPASKPYARMLDKATWAVTEYDFASGDFTLTRGVLPVVPSGSPTDPDERSFPEGEPRRAYRTHRRREWRARAAKIKQAMRQNGGKLICEVPRCGFDFHARYGAIGEGYAHVHHLKPLGWSPGETETTLSDLAVVCPNCHAMIHIGGECREMDTLIP